MNYITLTELVQSLSNEQIKNIYQEYVEWEKAGFLAEDALLRQFSLEVFGDSTVIIFEIVAKRIFQEATQRWVATIEEK
jgi:hypothetical protein